MLNRSSQSESCSSFPSQRTSANTHGDLHLNAGDTEAELPSGDGSGSLGSSGFAACQDAERRFERLLRDQNCGSQDLPMVRRRQDKRYRLWDST